MKLVQSAREMLKKCKCFFFQRRCLFTTISILATPHFRHFIKILHPETGVEFKVNSFWLRDHCRLVWFALKSNVLFINFFVSRCKECYSERTHQITSNLLKIPPNVQPVEIEQNNGLVNVVCNIIFFQIIS